MVDFFVASIILLKEFIEKDKTMNTNNKNFWTFLLSLAIPIAFQHLLINSLTFVDTLFMSQLGDVALSASGMASQCNWLLSMISFGICSGTTLFVSQYWGAKSFRQIEKTYAIAVWSALFASVVFAAAAFLFPRKIMSIFNNNSSVIDAGAGYLRYVAFSYPATVLSSVLCTVLRSTEKVKLPLAVACISTSVNVILDYALVFGVWGFPEMGIAGAAVATSVAAWVGLFVLILISRVQNNIIIMPIRRFFDFNKSDFIYFMKKASPVIINEMIWGFGMVITNAIYSNTGYENYAACTILRSIESFCLIMFIGLNDGGAVIIGKTFGENKPDLAYKNAKRLTVAVPLFSLVIGLFIILMRDKVIHIFNMSGNITDYTLGIANILVIIYGLEIAFRNIPYTLICAVFRPGGDSLSGVKYDLVCLWILSIPITAFAAFYLKLDFYYVLLLAYLVDDVPKVILCVRHFVSRKWIKPVVSHE